VVAGRSSASAMMSFFMACLTAISQMAPARRLVVGELRRLDDRLIIERV